MPTPEALNALADRVEREEPSRELDAAVLVACDHQAVNRGPRMGWEYRPNGVGIWQSMPSPTTSLDSAVTLVPEGWFLETLSDIFGDGMVYARLACPEPLREAQGCGGRTRALTLTAAALRARAANS